MARRRRQLVAISPVFVIKQDKELIKRVIETRRQLCVGEKFFRLTPIPAKGSLTNPAIGA